MRSSPVTLTTYARSKTCALWTETPVAHQNTSGFWCAFLSSPKASFINVLSDKVRVYCWTRKGLGCCLFVKGGLSVQDLNTLKDLILKR
eukprot:5389592-Amphidinium_carterae.1